LTEKDVLVTFEKHNALLSGHFKLSSGLHSGQYLQCALVLQHPDIAEKLAEEIAKKFKDDGADLVIGPALGGVTFAYEIARALGVRGLFTERQDGKMCVRRGFSIGKGEKAIVAEDVITTGGSTKEVIDVVESFGAKVIGVASVIDRSGGSAKFKVRFESLAKIKVETFEEKSCPLCKSGIPVTKPGSRGR
jgi:orotate phosphoribosyltransferase